jgi:hypothetical protein
MIQQRTPMPINDREIKSLFVLVLWGNIFCVWLLRMDARVAKLAYLLIHLSMGAHRANKGKEKWTEALKSFPIFYCT